ncbi:Na/Pi cotransporter family protein [Sanyastnella coralliicola]|uniref:Na/Pi cotransporter family protein n=1 Tax=Sanyastnella coralliicola TaxID=3069118 RepID=UPI0027BB00FC|nr:Na/Pi cotransporter family protein [Longitalea sp. SCSIO 12813]
MNFLLDILSITGALGLFIFGMKVMSDGVQKAAGSSMRRVLEAMTKSQGRAIASGFLTTAVLQSSSATTVMVVSFVNGGLLRLREAVGVIMGANIGTTVTAWVVALALGSLSIGQFTLPIIALALPFLFLKKERLRNSGEAIIGFAILFVGLQFLQEAVPNLKNQPDGIGFLVPYMDMGFLSNIIFVLVGTMVTLIVQSSSAAIALTLTLLSTGIIPLELAAAMVLGENIGTTITANIAAVIANRSGKLAARAHSIFNVIGVIWMLPLMPLFLKGLQSTFVDMFDAMEVFTGRNHDKVLIALFHTTFNLLNTLVLVGFTPLIIRLSERMVRKPQGKENFKLEFIGAGVVGTPELAILEAQREVERFARVTANINGSLQRLLATTDQSKRNAIIDEIRLGEEVTDKFEVEVSNYLTELSREELSDSASIRIRGLMGASADLERIGDLYFRVAMNLESKQMKKVYFVPKQRQNLKNMTDLLEQAFDIMLSNLEEGTTAVNTQLAQEKEDEVNALRDQLRRKHLKDVAKGRYSIESGVFYMDTFTTLEEIADHIVSVTEGLTNAY